MTCCSDIQDHCPGPLRVHGANGFAFASHWLKNWRESFKPITKRSNRNHVVTFDSPLKIALYCNYLPCWLFLRIS